MKVVSAVFVTSLAKGDQDFPGCGLPQVTVLGKSNVGKSSLVNCLANRKKLARTSGQPGHTRLINVYLFNEKFHLMDLPGYGYAKVSKQMKEDWSERINAFLMGSLEQVHILHLVDIRHEPGALDLQMAAWIKQSGVSCTVVLTKADKLSKSARLRMRKVICNALGVLPEDTLAFSSFERQGKEALLARIEGALEEEPWIEEASPMVRGA